VFAPLELPTVLDALEPLVAGLAGGTATHAAAVVSRPAPASDAEALSQANLWEEMAAFVRVGDIVLADQGTSFYGMATHRLPAGVTFVGQPLWASIGYTLPAMLGACTARPGSRGVLLIGDGAAQMTVQELGTLIRAQVPGVAVVVDNDGYTVERAIHGPDEAYNDISTWDWTQAPALFGGGLDTAAFRVLTVGELRAALDDATAHPGRFCLVQAVVPRDDVPDLLSALTAVLGRAARSTS
jgi:indolepyruvate decarboxylase